MAGLLAGIALGSGPTAAVDADLAALEQRMAPFLQAQQYDAALPIAKEALALAERKLKPDDPELAKAARGLGKIYYELNRYDDAEPHLERALAIREGALFASPLDVAESLDDLGLLRYWQKRYAEAEQPHKRALELREKALGADNLPVAESANHLADVYYFLPGRQADAEGPYKRAVRIREAVLGAEHGDTLRTVQDLADLYYKQRRYPEAEPLYRRVLAGREATLGPEHVLIARSLQDVAETLSGLGRHAEAEPLSGRAVAMRERLQGPEHVNVAYSLNQLTWSMEEQGRYLEAEPLVRRSLAIREKVLGAAPATAWSLQRLGTNLAWQGRFAEAEEPLKKAVTMREEVQGREHPDVAAALVRFAKILSWQGRDDEAEPLLKRALTIQEKAADREAELGVTLNDLADLAFRRGDLRAVEAYYRRALATLEAVPGIGPHHVDVAVSVGGLAALASWNDRYSEAEDLYKHALDIYEHAQGPDHPNVAYTLNNLANVYYNGSREAEAEPLYKRALAISEKTFGPDHTSVADVLYYLARLYQWDRRYAEAVPMFERSLAIYEKTFGPEHPYVADSFHRLAYVHFKQDDFERAAAYEQKSTDLLIRRSRRSSQTIGRELTSRGKSDAEDAPERFRLLVRAQYRLSQSPTTRTGEITDTTFRTAQWAQSSAAAASLAQMAVRTARGDTALAALVRERQDLLAKWRASDARLSELRADPPDRRDAQAESRVERALAEVNARLAEIDAILKSKFPDYDTLANPEPLSVRQTQGLLREDEALVQFLDMDEESFVWVVTPRDQRWARIEHGTGDLKLRVTALRCGLDETLWAGANNTLCQDLLGTPRRNSGLLPFDTARAQELYRVLFADIEGLIKGRHLLLVPSGPLTSLPFQVLVAGEAGASGDDYASTSWLIKSHALTVLPSVASLAALRRDAKGSTARQAFIGYGNPTLTGTARCQKIVVPDACPEAEVKVAAAPSAPATRAAGEVDGVQSYFRDGLGDVAAVKKLCPLPDTAHELRCVARSLGVDTSQVVLGADATEAAVKKAPLDRYRIVHFATHGLLAGETARLAKQHAEPALVFSPPDTATEEDDGLLTASEVAGLKLDADWVVMSACNTASGNRPGAEALSGLAKAFFYAGARALLVSHWPVDSLAATLLTSTTFAEMRNQSIGRSEAFRRAMLALIGDQQRSWAAHPSVWAPFVVVGEGGPIR